MSKTLLETASIYQPDNTGDHDLDLWHTE